MDPLVLFGTSVAFGWGAADLLYAFYNGLFGVELPPGSLGAAFFIPTAIVPLLFLTHAMMFRLLLQSRGGPVRPS